jgi:hypothetical protein
MTLVLACLTARSVYQVSDRRLTLLARAQSVVDDDRNKAVFVGRVSFAYTGIAKIGRERTDNWLARVISEGPTNDMAMVAERILSAATAAFLLLPGNIRHHAFQGVGWFRLKGENRLGPGIITVHNCIDEQTGTWSAEPFEQFRTSTQFPTSLPAGCVLHSVGVMPSTAEKNAIVRLVRKCVKHRHSTPATVLQSLTMSVRWLSRRHTRIGKNLLALSIPKRSVEEWERTGSMPLLAGLPNEFTATFAYVSPQGTLTWFGPHIVREGVVLTDVKVGSL